VCARGLSDPDSGQAYGADQCVRFFPASVLRFRSIYRHLRGMHRMGTHPMRHIVVDPVFARALIQDFLLAFGRDGLYIQPPPLEPFSCSTARI